MLERDLTPTLRETATAYPVVTLTGPRQSGKTTLVRATFPHHRYCNLEHPELRTLAREDPKAFFAAHPTPMIIDEVQRVPDLLSWIQVRVDEDPTPGSHILTGSHQFRLHEAITQSLAGRTALLRLLPFSIAELRRDGRPLDKNRLLVDGCMPRVHADHLDPTTAYRNYFQTYVERDVRQLIQIRNLDLFEKFMRLLAARIGQVVNVNSFGNDVGVSGHTLREWLSILEASYIIFTLPPYYRNFGKRLIKSPKLYFVEPGLASWLLGIETPEQAERDPLHGQLFENLAVTEALKARYHQGRDPNLYFWRDSAKREVDLLYERQRHLQPIEIKSAMTWNAEFTRSIEWFQRHIPSAERGAVIYAGDQFIESEHWRSLSYLDTASLFTTA